MKTFVSITVFVVAIFLLSGGVSYFYALNGLPIRQKDMVAFVRTPVALLLVMFGASGMLMLTTVHKPHNPRWKAWLKMAVGFGMIVLAWLSLELLLVDSYIKRN